jgi:hypothetical protein
MAFGFFKNQFELDEEKYMRIIERNKQNGMKGGRRTNEEKQETSTGGCYKPSGTQKNPNNPVGFLGTQTKPNDNDNDTVLKKSILSNESIPKENTPEKNRF